MTDPDLVERVAKAMWAEATKSTLGRLPWDDISIPLQNAHLTNARAALTEIIKALREHPNTHDVHYDWDWLDAADWLDPDIP